RSEVSPHRGSGLRLPLPWRGRPGGWCDAQTTHSSVFSFLLGLGGIGLVVRRRTSPAYRNVARERRLILVRQACLSGRRRLRREPLPAGTTRPPPACVR